MKQASDLKGLLDQTDRWSNSTESDTLITYHLNQFIENIFRNFGEDAPAYQTINSVTEKQQWLKKLHEAIRNHRSADGTWKQLFA